MKPLREWTLQEVKEYCSDINNACECCVLKDICDDFSSDAPSGWTLTPPPQMEEIEWHKYPDEEPPVNHENYLVKLKHTRVREVRFDGKRLGDQFASDFQPTSWAKMPKGYTED